MGHREARRVPLDWEHPREPGTYSDGKPRYIGLQSRDMLKYYGPDEGWSEDDFMPDFPEGTATGWQLYETTSEGTPVSPVFATAEELAAWCETGASVFAGHRWTREQWLASFRDDPTGVESLLFLDASGLHVGDPAKEATS
jgi:hypothetical protein